MSQRRTRCSTRCRAPGQCEVDFRFKTIPNYVRQSVVLLSYVTVIVSAVCMAAGTGLSRTCVTSCDTFWQAVPIVDLHSLVSYLSQGLGAGSHCTAPHPGGSRQFCGGGLRWRSGVAAAGADGTALTRSLAAAGRSPQGGTASFYCHLTYKRTQLHRGLLLCARKHALLVGVSFV